VLERRRKYAATGFGSYQTIELNLPPNTTSYTDSDVLPGKTYEYRLTAETDDTSGSTTAQTTTAPPQARERSIPCRGWFVEVDHPDGTTRRLSPSDEAVALPTLNGRPAVEIPVRPADHWADSDTWERQPMRVWRDGERLPIESVAEIRDAPGDPILVGRGGDELLQRHTKTYGDASAHEVLRDALGQTSYSVAVDSAPAQTNATFATYDTTADFQQNAKVNLPKGDDIATALIDPANDELKPLQTGFFTAASQISGGTLETDRLGVHLRHALVRQWGGVF